MPLQRNSENLRLRRAAHAVEALVSSVLDILWTTWMDRLCPALRDERSGLDNLAEKLREEESAGYPDDYLTDDYAVIESTEQILIALQVVAVYHVFEQHMVRFFYHRAKQILGQKPTDRPQLYDVVDSVRMAWSVDLKALKSWPDVDELRLAANCVKHGEGDACRRLRRMRAGWFETGQIVIPLGAFGLKIPAEYLEHAIGAVKSFLSAMRAVMPAPKVGTTR